MKKIIFLYSLILFLVITYPLWISTGYVFSLDNSPLQSSYYCRMQFDGLSPGVNLVWCFFGKIFPDFMFIRCIFVLTFGLLMSGGYYISKDTKNVYAILFCITMLCVNPFFYGRIMDGQINVYLASAMFVWFIYFLKKSFQTQLMRYAILLGVMTLFLAMTSLYALYLSAFSYGVFWLVYFFGSHTKKKLLKKALIFGLVGGAVNMLWLIPSGHITSLSGKIDSFQSTVFYTAPGLYSAPVNAALLRGYWGETQNRFVTLDQLYKYPSIGILLMIIIWMFVIFGIFHLWHHNRRLEAISMMGVGVMGYVLSLGTNYEIFFQPGIQFLYNHLPFYEGFREPQKWMILLVLAYAYFGSYGVKELFSRMGTFQLRKYIMIFLVSVPLISTPLMLFGFMGQLEPKHFPQEWIDVRQYFKNVTPTKTCPNKKVTKRCYTFLYLPWYEYISLGWVEKTTLAPWLATFMTDGGYNLVGDNAIIGNVWSTYTRPESKIIERFIRRRGQSINVLEQLQEMFLFQQAIKKMGIQYIIVFRDHKYTKEYIPFLDRSVEQKLLGVAKENALLKIYKVIY